MVAGFASPHLCFLAHSTRPRISDGRAVRYVDASVVGLTVFRDGAVATMGEGRTAQMVHRTMADAPMAMPDAHLSRIRAAQSLSSRYTAAVLLLICRGDADIIALNRGRTRDGYKPEPLFRPPSAALAVWPPGGWPELDDAPFETAEQDLTELLSGDRAASADDVIAGLAKIFTTACELSEAVSETFQVVVFRRARRAWEVTYGEHGPRARGALDETVWRDRP